MRLLIFLAAIALATAATAQNQVVVQNDSVFIKSPEGYQIPVTSADVRARVAEYAPKKKELDEILQLYQKIASMREQAIRLRDEETVLNGLLLDVESKEAEIAKIAKKKQ